MRPELGALLLLVALLIATIFLAFRLASTQCEATATAMGVKFKYSIWTDCMVEHDGKMVPLNNLRVL